MKKIWNILSSTKTALVLLVLFTIAMATATFIENSYDTTTARLLVYNSKWFEVILLLMAVNFAGNLSRYNFLSRAKASGFLFHFAFILILAGAAITRYVGVEGIMHIREGEKSNAFYSTDPYLMISAENSSGGYYQAPHFFSGILSNDFHIKIDPGAGEAITVDYVNYVKNAIEKTEEKIPGGINIVELLVTTSQGSVKQVINEGESVIIGSTTYSYNGSANEEIVNISGLPGNLTITFPFDIKRKKMVSIEAIPQHTTVEFNERYSFDLPDATINLSAFYPSAKKILVPGNDPSYPDGLVLKIQSGSEKKEVIVWGGPEHFINFREVQIEGKKLQIGYGQKAIELPFSIQLNDFILERYPGSNSPSSYESKVTLIDNKNNINESHRIFMNHVLDYEGYRFFQSSYDNDEMGTILSVNDDFWGTWITYAGYILLGLGLLITLFNKNSRFVSLIKLIKNTHMQRMSVMVVLIFFRGILIAEENKSTFAYVEKAHAEKFSRLIVQGNDGRFQPVHTLASDVIHKISRKDKFEFSETGELNAVQVFLSMMVNPELWKQKKIIYIREESVKEAVGVTASHAAFDDFFDTHNNYKLQQHVENAFRKKSAEQNKFDKEIIKVDERMNVVMMVMQGEFLRIFPEQGSVNYRWINWNDDRAYTPLDGNINILNEEMNLPVFNYNNIFRLYFTELIYAVKSGNFERADKVLSQIQSIQQHHAIDLPAENMIRYEILYNNLDIFGNLKQVYGLLSILLLVLSFIDTVKTNKNKMLQLILTLLITISVIAFLFHTYGLGLRWYLTGHAPWSNGYETLVFVGWSGMLAGFCFLRFSKITVAATTLLAFFTLMTAGHSSYDPQLTNLVPVLKSYWLIFHVAALSLSYGFLGLSFILGLIILVLYLTTSQSNYSRNILLIKEWTYINEMNITIGLVFATIGTFLGGIWANESWGRYWGWDAKETWALIIIIAYSVVLHLRLVPWLRSEYIFNVSAVTAFGTVLMTFFGVNYYFTKGLHSYASGDAPVFPLWAWVVILLTMALFLAAGLRDKQLKKFQ